MITFSNNSTSVVHRIAISALIIVTILNIVSTIIVRSGALGTQLIEIALGTAVWGFLTYKIWKRPRRWGLGVGLLLFVALAFQIYLFAGAHSSGVADTMGILGHPILFAIWELPLLVAAISCCLLRSYYRERSQ